MKYKILKGFKGSQDGRFAADFEEGYEYDLSDYLVSCVPDEWIKKVTGQIDIETPEDKHLAIENQAIHTPKRKAK